LEAELYSGNTGKSRRRPEPDWNQIHRELSRKGVTLQLLWLEYKDRQLEGYQYFQFCERYRVWSGKLEWSCARTTGPARRVSRTR
jgi:transposase